MKGFLGFLLCTYGGFALACSCSSPDLVTRVEGAKSIVIGKVVSVSSLDYLQEEHSAFDSLKGRIVVQEVLKGKAPSEIELVTGMGSGDCGLGFQVLDTYIFFLNSGVSVNGCQGHILDGAFRRINYCLPDDAKTLGLPTYEDRLDEVRRLIGHGI